MGQIVYDKLVRDRIPEIIRAQGRQCQTDTLCEEEYRRALWAKLEEETAEAQRAAADDLLGEFADLYEVLGALATSYGIDLQEIQRKQADKRVERGGFERRVRLLTADEG